MTNGLRHERRGDVLVVTLDRPDSRNAVTAAMSQEFSRVLGDIAKVAAIVVTGSGSAFCAGLDLAEVRAGSLPSTRFVHELAEADAPVVCAVNGPAVAAGFDLAMAGDIVICGPTASFLDAHVRVGLPPPPRLIEVLRRRVGDQCAMEMLLTLRSVEADEAVRLGLAREVVANPESRALELATAIAAAPAAVRTSVVRAFRS